jgi:catechol 2,3-dioxygenase-like lactoylglutathione lyase family enzyme
MPSLNTDQGEIEMGQQVVVSLGVDDLERAKLFFRDGLGFEIDRARGPFVEFMASRGGITLGVYTGEPFAFDDGLASKSGAHRGITLACIVDAPEQVNELMTRAERAGAQIVDPAHEAVWGGYIGYFTDVADNLWKVVVRQDD